MFWKRSLLALGIISLLAPVYSLARPAACANCAAVPDGGSSAEYVVAFIAICVVALFLRTRRHKARAS